MAAHMVTPLQRIGQGIKGVTMAIGTGLNPALDPLINYMADVSARMTAWMGKYENITKLIGKVVLGVLGFVAAMGALNMVVGLSRLGLISLKPTITAAKWALSLFTKQGIIGKTVMLAFRSAMWMAKASIIATKWALSLFTKHALLSKLASLGLWAAMVIGKGVMLAFQGVLWLVNAAMAANPAVLITLAVLALIGAVAAAIYWWDDLKAAFMDSAWGQAIMKVIDVVLGGLKTLTEPIGWVIDKIGAVAGFFGFGDSGAPSSSPSLETPRRAAVGPGGVTSHIAKTVSNNSSNTRSIGQVTINSEQPMTKQSLEELLFAGT
jgi:hypothetical protein